jgi:hypothetical protein
MKVGLTATEEEGASEAAKSTTAAERRGAVNHDPGRVAMAGVAKGRLRLGRGSVERYPEFGSATDRSDWSNGPEREQEAH